MNILQHNEYERMRQEVIVHSTRRKNIGKDNEYVEENPDLADFFFKSSEGVTFMDQGENIDGPLTIMFDNDNVHVISEGDEELLRTTGIELKDGPPGELSPGEPSPGEDEDLESEIDLDDILPKLEQGIDDEPEGLQEVYDQFEVEDDPDYRFDRIVDHFFKTRCSYLKGQLHR